uniref:zinc finger protein 2-like n=1 Tax=Erigeron canadensis TaxID=72917 RepID=UPI001CB99191|nr:zinc finger protein 2-like [Erigeron canadensis]
MSFLNLHQPDQNDLTSSSSSSSSSSSFLSSLQNADQRVFSCSYCRKKFYSPQAFGGHQNAHKLERTLAKKSREQSLAARHQPGSNHVSSTWDSNGSTHDGHVQPSMVLEVQHQERFDSTLHKGESDLDLSLKL